MSQAAPQSVTPARRSAPLVSIGVPVFNAAHYLESTLRSLLAQDYPNIELCISDNASTDGSREICERIATSHANVRLNLNPRNLGMVENFERVRKMACGSYFFWAGADDAWSPNFVSALVADLEAHPESPLAMSATAMIDNDNKHIGVIAYEGAFDPNSMSPMRQFAALMTVSTEVKLAKFNLFFCGLWRMSDLNAIVDADPGIHFGGDRPMPAIGALIGGLRYVPQPLFIKRMHEKTFLDRNNTDPYVLLRQEHGVGTVVRNMVRWITMCPRVPVGRKVMASLYMLHFLRARAMDLLVAHTPAPMRKMGGQVLRSMGLLHPAKHGQ